MPKAKDQERPRPRNFVLVHGAWHGGWCWRRVSDRLTSRGHHVFAPTLTGLGERAHLLAPGIDLDTHIADVVNLLRWERLEEVVLCGHSYGGMVISGVAEKLRPALAALVFLDAFVPADGEAMGDITGPATRAHLAAALERGAETVPPRPAAAFQVNERDRAWVDALMTPQPIRTLTQPIRLAGARERVARKAYIRAARYDNPAFEQCYERLRQDPAWRVWKLDCGHDVMIDLPDRLAEILEEAG